MTRPDFSMITKDTPEKKLLVFLQKTGGRSHGKISVRHHGGGAKRMYRIIEFGELRTLGKSAKVLGIEYDPNRNARIALVEGAGGEPFGTAQGERAYIIAPQGLGVGSEVMHGEKTEVKIGNRLPLRKIPVGTHIYNIELTPGKGGKLARSAGASSKVLAVEGKYATVELPSGEVRKVLDVCYASIGAVSNEHYKFERIGKAGRRRHMGRRPEVRGAAMNPVDHPHGGGEGRAPRGMKHPKTKWGKNAYGVKTRRRHKYSNKWILQRRKTIR